MITLQDTLISKVTKVSLECPDKPIIPATHHKIYEGQVEGIRKRNDYYKSGLNLVKGFVFEKGEEIKKCILWPNRACH